MNYKQKIRTEEGRRYKVYDCSLGYPTIADGVKLPLTRKELKMISGSRGYPITNKMIYSGFKITNKECNILLDCRLEPIIRRLNKSKVFLKAPQHVRIVLIDMSYNIGLAGLSKFKKMLKAINEKNFGIAAEELLDSKYAKQVPERCERNIRLLLQ